VEKIFAVTGIKIVEYPQVDQLMCMDCVRALEFAVQFRSQCRKSDEEFRKTLWNYEQKKWSEDPAKIHDGTVNEEEEVDYGDIKCKVEIEDPEPVVDYEVSVNFKIFDKFFNLKNIFRTSILSCISTITPSLNMKNF
jgi:hypothetical protein